MFEGIKTVLRRIFPFPEPTSARTFLRKHAEDPKFIDNFQKLQSTTVGLSIELQNHLYTHARNYLAEEQNREVSIISRAQGLLVAQTFFGILLAFGGAAMGHAEIYRGWRAYPTAILVIYILGQIVLLSANALRAVGGLPYRRIGTSDLIGWLPRGEVSFIREIALMTLDNYRRAAISNNWRVVHLQLAQICLRNTIVALAALVVFVFLITIFPEFPLSLGTVGSGQHQYMCGEYICGD